MDELIKLDQVDEIAINIEPADEIDLDFGEVVGVVRPPETESLEVTATREEQLIKPSGFGVYFDEVKVNPIPKYVVDVSETTATAETVLQGQIFYDFEGTRTEGVAELKEDLDAELTAQDEAITRLEVAVDELPESKADIDEVKLMDLFDNIFTGRPIVERDYTDKEIKKLDRILANITQGEVVNG